MQLLVGLMLILNCLELHKNTPRHLVDASSGMSTPPSFTGVHAFFIAFAYRIVADFFALNAMSSQVRKSLKSNHQHT